jgi:predicted metal-dependent phosphoesterase TrpH
LLDGSHVRTVQEAFEKYLGISRPAYVGKYPLSPAQAIGMIRRVGGIPALAHPLFTRVDEVLPKLVDQRLQAIEVYLSRHDATATGHFEELATRGSSKV